MKACPCHAQQGGAKRAYRDCCQPFHQGLAPPFPEALMRSRYSAYALGLGQYLYDTLSFAHPDRRRPNANQLVKELSLAAQTQRFVGLRILFAEADEVLFFAKIFVRGADHSFAELSKFTKEEGWWRYLSGDLVSGDRLPKNLATLSREAFLLLVRDA